MTHILKYSTGVMEQCFQVTQNLNCEDHQKQNEFTSHKVPNSAFRTAHTVNIISRGNKISSLALACVNYITMSFQAYIMVN